MAEQTVFVEVHAFRRGEVIFREGEDGGCAYEVQSGKVGIVAGYGTDREKVLTELGTGSIFGEMGMVRGLSRSATAVALEPNTGVSIITWNSIGRYFVEKPAKIIQIMQQMGERINALSDDYLDACSAIADLIKQRDELIQECEKKERALAKLEDKLRRAGVGETFGEKPEAPPAWRRLAGESEREENERFKKYLEAYRNYQKRKAQTDE